MSTGVLDFFILEGSECVERLDGLLARAASGTPDTDALARNARVLRGSATMAKVRGIPDIAGALERIAKGLGDGRLQWTPRLRGAVVAAIDDLKILIRAVRNWGDADDGRAARCSQELNVLAPAAPRPASTSPVTATGGATYLAMQTSTVAAGILQFADNPGPRSSFAGTLARIRALRGVSTLLDLPPLAEVVAAVDDAAKGLEIGSTTVTDRLRELFRAAAVVLREGSDAIQAGGRPDPGTPAVLAFAAAAQSLVDTARDDDLVVPIHTLFPDGGGENIVHAEPHPPTTSAQRFQLEVASQAEHLRRLVGDARRAADAPARQRLEHELRIAIRSLSRFAGSFGESAMAGSLGALVEPASALDPTALARLDELAGTLALQSDERVAPRTAQVAPRTTPVAPNARRVAPRSTPVATAPSGEQAVTAPLAAAPSGAALHDLLGAGISGLSSLNQTPLAEPTELEDDGVVPVQHLLYRGQAALHRAAALGQEFRQAGSTPNAGALAELYDLLELAVAD
jgi:chemotaxis protein histidine kinase CheA